MTATLRPKFGSYRDLLVLAGPLILSQTSVMLMQLVDGRFLTRYSPSAIAAAGPSGLGFWGVLGLFAGMAGYAGTFVAQYVGAGRPRRVGAAVWQGVYLALAGGAAVVLLSLAAGRIFALGGHSPEVQKLEVTYFRILCYGSPLMLVGAALSGFFTGRNDNLVLMAVQMLAAAANAVLAWALIFGRLGLPEMGLAGAAWAIVIAQGLIVLFLGLLFLRRRHRRDYATWADRAPDWGLLKRLAVFGFPNGLRMVIEIQAWTVFLFFVGRIDPLALSASTIAFRINAFAFFPVIGLGIAVAMLVGQAQGAGRPDLARRVAWRGMALGQAWMLAGAAAFVLLPYPLAGFFLRADAAPMDQAQIEVLRREIIVLLRFVAAYCVLDGCNVIFVSALQGAGDTRWTLAAMAAMNALFVGALFACDHLHVGLYAYWGVAMTFVLVLASVWVVRFLGGRWESMRVIEPTPGDLAGEAEESR